MFSYYSFSHHTSCFCQTLNPLPLILKEKRLLCAPLTRLKQP